MKKRILACIVFMAVLCTAFSAFAEETEQPITGSCGEKLRYEYYQSTRTLTIIGNGNIPNYPSDKIEGSIAPWRNDSRIDNYLEKVVISDGVTSIGENAFFWCDKITSVTISSSVKSIGIGAFYSCKALTGITIPNGAESIGEDAFQYCDSLKEVTIPGSVKSIGEGAFSNCYYEKTDDDYNITYSRGLEKVIIQDGVETIGVQAFYMCKKLNTIELPDSVKSIGHWAFYDTGCYNDWEDSDDDVLYIGNHFISAYQGKSTPCNIKFGTKTIADSAFFACGDLPAITIPDSVVSIGKHAFENCNSLKSITIPRSVTSIGNEAFYSCFDLSSITVDPDNPAYCSESGVLYSKAKTEIIRFPKEKAGDSFAIPAGVIKIADGAFEDCRNLKNVTIPDGVISIGNRAFENCYFATYKNYKIVSEIGLEEVTIPDSVTSIGDRAFLNCSKLTGITIPDGVMKIGESTFYNCRQLTNITIPNSVLIIDTDAFEGCTDLQQVYYIGSESEWDNEVIGAGKYVLTGIGITYLSGISAKRSEDGNIVVKPINIDTGKTVTLALYNGNILVEIQSKIYDGAKITFTPVKDCTRAIVMIWESLDSLSPVCGAKTVNQ